MVDKSCGQALSALALAAALSVSSGAANAAIVTSFASLGGAYPLSLPLPSALPPGETLLTDFSGATGPLNGGTVFNTGGGTIPESISYVAAPWTPTGGWAGNFFAVQNGQSATWDLTNNARDVSFYVGSLDAGNEITFDTTDEGDVSFSGTQLSEIPGAGLPGDGDATITGSVSNGRFTFIDTTGYITGFTLAETGTDTGNSLEVAQIATSAPEPSTWALLALGFATLGFAGYRKDRVARAIAV